MRSKSCVSTFLQTDSLARTISMRISFAVGATEVTDRIGSENRTQREKLHLAKPGRPHRGPFSVKRARSLPPRSRITLF